MRRFTLNFVPVRADTSGMFIFGGGKSLIGLGGFVGTIVGGFVPSIWGDNSMFSPMGMLLSVVGGVVGIWAGYRVSQNLDL